MKQFMVTLQSEVAGEIPKEQFVINAKNLNEALEQVATRAKQEYDLTGWEDKSLIVVRPHSTSFSTYNGIANLLCGDI